VQPGWREGSVSRARALASLGVFMTALDTLVVTTALPVLRVDLHASLPSLEWTVNAYPALATSGETA
jgi:MFS family permease